MNPRARVVAIAAVLTAAVVAVLLFRSGSAPDPAPTGLTADGIERNPSAGTLDDPATAGFSRIDEGDGTAEANPRDYPLGVWGRVLDPSGQPVAGAQLYLVRAMDRNIVQRLRQAMRRESPVAPIMAGVTDGAGRFELGFPTLADATLELRVVTDRFVEYRLPGILAQDTDWREIGDIHLEDGAIVTGRVTSEGNPIEGAEVTIKKRSAEEIASPTPGREKGILVLTDANGMYRIPNGPQATVVVDALAAGYARSSRTAVPLVRGETSTIDFELSPEATLRGSIVDPAGNPIAEARILATTTFRARQQISEAGKSNQAGAFEVQGLNAGRYAMQISARGYQTKTFEAETGADPQTVVLRPLSVARVKVLDADGTVCPRYEVVAYKSHPENQDWLEILADHEPQVVRASMLTDGVYGYGGLEEGTFRFAVEAEGYATSYSPLFEVSHSGDPAVVEVRLVAEGRIQGTVLDEDQNPLAGARVSTQHDNWTWESDQMRVLNGGLFTHRSTRAEAVTDASGQFTLSGLVPGSYQVVYTHPDCFEHRVNGNAVHSASTLELDPVRLLPGTRISGVVRVDGKPSAGVKVYVHRHIESGQTPFSATGFTLNDGRFTIDKLVPPGRFTMTAARTSGADTVFDLKTSETRFQVSGERNRRQNLEIQTRK